MSEKEDELKEETMRLFVGTQSNGKLAGRISSRSYLAKGNRSVIADLKEILKYQDADQFRCLFDKRDELLDLYDDIQLRPIVLRIAKPVFDTSSSCATL